MLIVYHHRTQGKGAEGVHVREIVNALRGLGHEVAVVAPPGVNLAEKGVAAPVALGRSMGWISKCLPQLLFECAELAYNFSAHRKLSALLSSRKVDAVYERFHFFGFAGSRLAKKYGVPFICEVNEVSGIERVRGQVMVLLAKRIERKVFSRADAIVVVSSFLKDEIIKLGVNADKIHVIPNGANIELFTPETVSGDEVIQRFNLGGKVVLGFVGGLVGWHNFDFLFSSFKAVLAGNRQSVLMLVGDGPLRTQLEAKVAAIGLEGQVVFTGNVAHADIPKYIQAMDVCVIPHSNAFRSPIKLFEYMAMAKPVLAPAVGPICEVVCDGENAILFAPEEQPSFLKAVGLLIADVELRKSIGSRARATVLERHLWKHNAERVARLVSD